MKRLSLLKPRPEMSVIEFLALAVERAKARREQKAQRAKSSRKSPPVPANSAEKPSG